jgi:hypothetical protein
MDMRACVQAEPAILRMTDSAYSSEHGSMDGVVYYDGLLAGEPRVPATVGAGTPSRTELGRLTRRAFEAYLKALGEQRCIEE